MPEIVPSDFEAGVEAGKFPRVPVDSAGRTLTTGSSHWLGMRCTTCHHTFRRGDLVLVGADLAATRHLDPSLRCGSPEPADEDQVVASAEEPGGFVAGLLAAWPPITGVPVYELTAGHWQVTGPRSGPGSPTCRGCGHTFRPGDHVIICPCAGPENDPRRAYCQTAVHRDPARGLCCWDDWAPSGRLTRCPRTLEKTSEKTAERQPG